MNLPFNDCHTVIHAQPHVNEGGASKPNIIHQEGWNAATHGGDKKNSVRVAFAKYYWGDKIKEDKIGWTCMTYAVEKCMNWIQLVQRRVRRWGLVNTVMNLHVP